MTIILLYILKHELKIDKWILMHISFNGAQMIDCQLILKITVLYKPQQVTLSITYETNYTLTTKHIK